jgi:hypothetical protein
VVCLVQRGFKTESAARMLDADAAMRGVQRSKDGNINAEASLHARGPSNAELAAVEPEVQAFLRSAGPWALLAPGEYVIK